MSDLSMLAVKQLERGDLSEARRLAAEAVQSSPDDWHAHYVLGQSLRFSNDFSEAAKALGRAHQLACNEPEVLLALGIARQHCGTYNAAIEAFRKALLIDPDYVLAINSLAMTQTLTGQFEEANSNYELALQALTRSIVKSWRNAANIERLPHADSRNSLWAEHAAYAALWLGARDLMDGISWPTGEMAEDDKTTRELEGWYWNDLADTSGKKIRFYCPNFFTSFHSCLLKGQVYKDLVGNRSAVLNELGKTAEAVAHLEEAEDFSR